MTKTNHSLHVIRNQDEPVRQFNFPEIEPELPEIVIPTKKASKPIDVVNLDITAIVVNFRTKHLVTKAIGTFRKFYPKVPLIIIDNHSQDKSWDWIQKQANEYTITECMEKNLGHGPALHCGILLAKTKYVFTFDSDVEFKRGGFLEQMQTHAEKRGIYALGWLRHVNENGVPANDQPRFCRYIHPYAALYNKDIYVTLKPFSNRGAPCVDNMWDARKRGISVASYPIDKFVTHLVAGTRRLYNGHWNPGDKKPEVGWNPVARIPI